MFLPENTIKIQINKIIIVFTSVKVLVILMCFHLNLNLTFFFVNQFTKGK